MFIEHQAELRSRSSFRSEIDSAFAHEWAHQPNGLDGFYKHGIPTGFWRRDLPVLLLFTLLIFCAACSQTTRSSGIPAGAQTAIDASIEDIDAGRYEKLYQEAADEWRQSA